MDARSILSPTESAASLEGSGFRNSESHLVGAFTTADFRSAVQFVDRVAVVADELNHHPDVRLGWGHVEFELTSHDVGGVTRRDVDLALRIRAIADELGATPD